MEATKEVSLPVTMLPTHQRPVWKQFSAGVVDLDVIREWLCMILFIEHDHGAVVLEKRLEVEIKRHGLLTVEEQPCCLDTVGDVAPA